MNKTIKFVDLFAGIGGIRKGFELACKEKGFHTKCVFTSEIKPYAIKAFNRESSPAFDIADFKAFVNELIEKPYHIDTDFLIFGYVMDEETGDVIVKDLWLKKIWEITKTMSNWPITVQYKNGILQRMRPGNWYTTRGNAHVFESMTDYLSAFEETIYQNPETRTQGAQWKNRFKRSYKNHYGVDIDFPKWDDIKGKYGRC